MVVIIQVMRPCFYWTNNELVILFFPTSLCGVLVFGSVSHRLPPTSRQPPANPLSHNLSTHNLLTQLVHTQLVHTQLVFTQLAHTQLAHTPPHTQLVHTQFVHTKLVLTQLAHTQLAHTQLVHTQLAHTQLVHTRLAHTQLNTPPPHTHNLSTRNLLTQNLSTHTQLHSHTTPLTHNSTHTQLNTPLTHTQIAHTQLNSHNLSSHHTTCSHVAGVALGDIYLHFAWRAWNLWHWAGFGGALASQVWRWALRLLAWQVWHLATSIFTLRGRHGVGDIYLHFAWQAWHLWQWAGFGGALGSQVWRWAPRLFWRGRCGTWRYLSSLCVAGVALMALGWLWWRAWFSGVTLGAAALLAWQAWHLAISIFTLRGRRGTYGTGLALVARLVLRCDAGRRGSFGVAGVALGDIYLHFAWQAWHLWQWAGFGGALGSQVWRWAPRLFWRGRRGTWRYLFSLCVAGVALMALGWLWWRAWFSDDVGAAALLAWQAWHLAISIFTLRGRRGTYGTGLALVARLVLRWCSFWRGRRGTWRFLSSLCVAGVARMALGWLRWGAWGGVAAVAAAAVGMAGVALGDIHLRFTWQACYLVTTTSTSCGRSGTWWHRTKLSHTIFHTQLCHTHPIFYHTIFHTPLCHTPSFTHNFVTPSLSHPTFTHTIFHTQLCHTPSLTPLCHTPSFTHHTVTHTIFHTTLSQHLSRTQICHTFCCDTTLSHTVFHTPLCHTPSLSHTIFHTQLCHTPSLSHTPSFTHNFVTHHLLPHHLSHATLSHTIFYTQLCHTQSFTTPSFTHTQLCHPPSFLHLLLCLSFLPRPRYNICCSSLEEVDLWGYPVLQFPTPWCCRWFQPSAILASWDHQLKCAWGRCWVSKSRTTWRSGVKRTFLEVNQRQHEPKDSQCHASIFRHKIWNIFHSFTLAGTVAGKERTGAGSVPCLGIRFSSLRTTSVIYGYSLNRKIYRCIWTWFQEACTCVRDDHQDIVIESYFEEDVATYQ